MSTIVNPVRRRISGMDTLGDRVRRTRKKLGMPGDALAKAIGISKAGISNIETGKTKNPQPKNLLGIATALGVSYEWLLYGKDASKAGEDQAPYGLTPEEWAFIHMLRGLTPGQREEERQRIQEVKRSNDEIIQGLGRDGKKAS